MKSIHSEIEINAPVEKVWSILMDFSKYPEWNPFVVSISGQASEGKNLKVVLKQPEGNSMTFKPVCLVCKEYVEFRWLGHLVVKGLFDGEHIFKLRELPNNRTKFVQSENFKGILLPLFWKMLNTKTIKGFQLMNKAIKERAET